MCMGGRDNKGDGLANQPRRYWVPGHLGLRHKESERGGWTCRLPLVFGKHGRQLAWRPFPSHIKCELLPCVTYDWLDAEKQVRLLG